MKQFYLSLIVLCIGFFGFGQKYYPQSGNTYVVASGSSSNLTDPVSLTLGPNTHIQSGATFTAKIVPEAAVVFPSYSNITLSDQNYVF
ncbi:hypothetical protein DSM03_1171, partial [Leeuwenhoekiella aestuarii]|uniref:hypothetical protein n=1 Tax=Leeuwenhoekiella aestuarii TaxID=2249426 RepID=UPI001025F75E